jgi:hypothetical protein
LRAKGEAATEAIKQAVLLASEFNNADFELLRSRLEETIRAGGSSETIVLESAPKKAE